MKSQIRIEIEKIIKNHDDLVYVDACNENKTKYRMKFVTPKRPSNYQIDKIKKLPNVIDSFYFKQNRKTSLGYYDGIVVYFDCKPSEIQLLKSPDPIDMYPGSIGDEMNAPTSI